VEQSNNQKEAVKKLIARLQQGAKLNDVLADARKIFAGAKPEDISRVEEELIKEGMPRPEVLRLCDAHMAVLQESLGEQTTLGQPGHAVYILMEEHRLMLKIGEELKEDSAMVARAGTLKSVAGKVRKIGRNVELLRDSDSHYLREENVLFPILEKHGVTEPPAVMWMEHDKIRELKKSLYLLMESPDDLVSADMAARLKEVCQSLAETMASHFFKENNVLFPTAMRILNDTEWADIRQQFDEFGYCCFTPKPAIGAPKKDMGELAIERRIVGKDMIPLPTGGLSFAEVELLLNNLPVDITFVDKDDTVRYFSQPKERLFPRTKAILGLKVQKCHPEKSVQSVNRILEDFRSGRKDSAAFWINMGGKLIHISYFALRDRSNAYAGCMEVTQNITDIQKLQGEKRLS
jgi:DUF438 domain-containing protein